MIKLLSSFSPPWVNAKSRYQCVSIGLIDDLQIAFISGQDPRKVASWLDSEEASLILAESLRADRTLKYLTDSLINDSYEMNEIIRKSLSDFEKAAISELIIKVIETIGTRKENVLNWLALNYKLLSEVAYSSTASPMLWY